MSWVQQVGHDPRSVSKDDTIQECNDNFDDLVGHGQCENNRITSSHDQINADRSGVAIATANIVDANGNPVFDAQNTLHWEVSGPASLVGLSVYQTDIKKHEEREGTAYTVVPVSNVVRAADTSGKIIVTVSSEGLEPASIEINAVKPQQGEAWIIQPKLNDENRLKVCRDPNFVRKVDEVPLILFPIKENDTFDKNEKPDYQSVIKKFISRRNRGDYKSAVAFPVLVDVLAKNWAVATGI